MRGRALGLLHHLQAAGARPGTHTIILVDGLAPFVDTFWACVLGRVVAVPLAPGNADEHKAKFFRVLARLPSATLATERKVFDRLRTYAADNGLADRLARLERHTVFLDEISDVSVPGIEHRAAPDDVAFIQFSSGSTSEPKGVILTHRNLTTNIDAIAQGVRARHDDASLSWMPLTHDMGLIGFHLTPLFEGVDHWLMPTALFVRRPGLWIAKTSRAQGQRHVLAELRLHALPASRTIPPRSPALDLSARAHHLQRRGAHRRRPVPRIPRGARARAPRAERDVSGLWPGRGEPCRHVSRSRARRSPSRRSRAARSARATSFARSRPAPRTPSSSCASAGPCRIARCASPTSSATTVPPGTVGRILIRGDNVSSRLLRRSRR